MSFSGNEESDNGDKYWITTEDEFVAELIGEVNDVASIIQQRKLLSLS